MHRNDDLRVEWNRKLLHVCASLIPLAYLWLSRPVVLAVLGGLLMVAVVSEVLRRHHRRFRVLFKRSVGIMLRRREENRITGATYVLVGAITTIVLFPQHLAIPALLILALADTAASLVGLRFGRQRFLGKSLAGSLAYFLTAFAILWIVLPERRGVGFLTALLSTCVEALPVVRLGPVELNDNVLVPVLTAAILSGLT